MSSVPELHQLSTVAEDHRQKITQVCCATMQKASNPHSKCAFFHTFLPFAILTDTGMIYWQGSNGKDEDSVQYFSAAENVFAVQLAMTAESLAILDADGVVWTCGSNENRQLGNGGVVTPAASIKSLDKMRAQMPASLEKVEWGQRHTKISSIVATQKQYFALTPSGNVWFWGGSAAPIPTPLLALGKAVTVSKIFASVSLVTLCMGPAPIMFEGDLRAEMEIRAERRALEASRSLSYTKYGIRVNTTEPTSEIRVEWRRNELFEHDNDTLLIVSPGESVPALSGNAVAAEHSLPTQQSAGEMLFSLKGNGWGSRSGLAPVPPGTYEFVYMTSWDGQTGIVQARSAPITFIRDYSDVQIEYPTRVDTAPAHFVIKWKPTFQLLHASIVLFKLPERQLYKMIIVSDMEKTSEDVDLHMEGEYEVSVGRDYDHVEKKLSVILMELPNIVIRAPRLEFDDLRFEMEPGPYYVRQPIKVKWDIKEEARKLWKGTEYFGFYKVNDPAPYPMPVGGIIMLKFTDHEDKLHPPEKPGQWNLRLQVVTTSLIVLYERIIEVLPEKAAEPEPVKPPAVGAVQPVSASTSLPIVTVPSYTSWQDFFKACDIPDMFCGVYCTIMGAQSVDVKLIPSLEHSILEKMGIATPGHVLMIMNKVREIRTAEMKQHIGLYLSALASTGAIQKPIAEILGTVQESTS